MALQITHITLNTGHTTLIGEGDVSGETLARVGPWLSSLIACDGRMSLPTSSLSRYVAHAAVEDGALLLTVSGPVITNAGPMRGLHPPLATDGIAKHSKHTHLWALMTTGDRMPPPAPNIKMPSPPWCAAVIWPSALLFVDALEWLGDFERCVAWAWCNRSEP